MDGIDKFFDVIIHNKVQRITTYNISTYSCIECSHADPGKFPYQWGSEVPKALNNKES